MSSSLSPILVSLRSCTVRLLARRLLLQLKPGVHAHYAAHQVPVVVGAHPVRDDDAGSGGADLELLGTLAVLAVPDAEILHHGRVDLRRDPLGPAGRVEEVARAQEVDKERRRGLLRVALVLAAVTLLMPPLLMAPLPLLVLLVLGGDAVVLLGGALELAAAVVDLLLDILALGDLVKVLHADVALADLAVLAVVGPVLRVDAVGFVVVGGEAAHEDDLAAGLAERRDLVVGPPLVLLLAHVGGLEVLAQVLVGPLARALALEAHDDGLAAVLVEEAVDLVEHITEVFRPRQGNGESAVHEGEIIGIGIGGDSDVHEAHAVGELLGNANGLAPNGWKGGVAGGRVVRARDGKHGKWPFILKLLHPGVQLGRGKDGEDGPGGHVDGGEVVRAAVELLHDGRLLGRARDIGLVLVVLGLESETDDLAVGVGSADVGLLGLEGVDFDRDILLLPVLPAGNGLGGDMLGGVQEAGDGAGDVADGIAGSDFLGLESLDGHELDRALGEVADREVGHRGSRNGGVRSWGLAMEGSSRFVW